MDGHIRDRVEALFGVRHDHTRREQRLREILDELESMTDWKKI
jgi:hypothetical protein